MPTVFPSQRVPAAPSAFAGAPLVALLRLSLPTLKDRPTPQQSALARTAQQSGGPPAPTSSPSREPSYSLVPAVPQVLTSTRGAAGEYSAGATGLGRTVGCAIIQQSTSTSTCADRTHSVYRQAGHAGGGARTGGCDMTQTIMYLIIKF